MMTVRIGTITGREIKKNRDGKNARLMLQVRFSNQEDIQTVEYVTAYGQDENPINGTKVYVIQISPSYKIAIGVEEAGSPSAATGEKFLYSTDDDGLIKTLIKLLKSGIIRIDADGIEILSDADHAVRYSKLEEAFNELKTDFNNFVAVYNGHTQTVSGGLALAPTAQGSTSTADITPAKIDEIKVP